MKVKSEREIAQSCPTLRDPMDCSLPGSSVHGIFQARVLEWVAIAFSDFLSQVSPISHQLAATRLNEFVNEKSLGRVLYDISRGLAAPISFYKIKVKKS